MAVTREGLPKLVLVGAAAAPALLLLRCLELLLALWRQGASGPALLSVAAYALAFAVAAGLLLAALRLPPPWRANLALAVAASAVTVYGVELLLARQDDTPERRLTEALQVVEDMRRGGVESYPSIEPVTVMWARPGDAPSGLVVEGVPIVPLSARAFSRLVTCQDEIDGTWRAYETDEHGFYNPRGLWARAPVAIAAVGDSFTAGRCVPSEASMLAGVRRRVPDTVNAGMAGSGPLMMLAVLREYLPALRPRDVLWCHFGGNDLVDIGRERDQPLLRRYLEDGFRQGLLEKQDAIDRALDDYLERRLRPLEGRRPAPAAPSLADVLVLRRLRARSGLVFSRIPVPADHEYALLRTVLEQADWSVKGWGGRLHFVYLPGGTPRSIARVAAADAATGVAERTLSVARGLGLHVIDVRRAFSAHPDPDSLFACPERHHTEAGYQLAAEAVLAGLDRPASP